MFYNLSGVELVVSNFLLMILWDILIFILSVKIDISYFDPSKPLYREKKWEKSGKLYVNVLKIKKWKDFLPQYIGKNGFSKKHLKDLKDVSKSYIEQFIFETCRAEWNHFMCCLFSVVSLFVNTFLNGVIFSVFPILINFPFIIIQRYNRIRLKKLLKRSGGLKEGCMNYNPANA